MVVREDARLALLDLAKRAIRVYLAERALLVSGRDFDAVAPECRGAFVTLKTCSGDLRGCIGTVLPVGPLDETVAEVWGEPDL